MAQFTGRQTQYLPYGSVKLFSPPRGSDCGINQRFCQPTEQTDNISFQFLAAETDNLITDGTFPDGSHDSICGIQSWCGAGWGIVNNTAVHVTPTISNGLRQSGIFTINDFFKITFTMTSRTVGSISVLNISSTGAIDTIISSIDKDGTYIFYHIAAHTGDFRFAPASNFEGAISNVEVVQVATASDYTIDIFNTETSTLIDNVPSTSITGSTNNNVITVDFNWADDVTVTNGCREMRIFLQGGGIGDPGNLFEDTFETDQGWTLFGGVTIAGAGGPTMRYTHAGAAGNAAFIDVLEVGTEYTVTYDILNYVSGTVRVRLGATDGITRSANGTFTETLTCTNVGRILFLFFPTAGAGVMDIDNVIVSKAVTAGVAFDGQSECFDLQTSHDCSFLWVWSNDNRWGNFDYSVITGGSITNFEHKLRIICAFRGTKYPTERNIGEDSAGVKSVDYMSLRKTKLMDIDFAPDYIHDAIAAFFAHDTRTINGTSFVMDDEYEPSSPNESKVLFKDLMNSTIEIQETTQANLINRNE